MKTFNLYERPDGRIVLAKEEEPESTLLRVISAPSWKQARATIDENEFMHDIGHGWFNNPLPGAYRREREYHERQTYQKVRMTKLFANMHTEIRRGPKCR